MDIPSCFRQDSKLIVQGLRQTHTEGAPNALRSPTVSCAASRIVRRLAVNGKDVVFRDRAPPGFGVRVYPTGRKVYVVQTRTKGRSKRVTVSLHGETTADQARNGPPGSSRASRPASP